MQSNVEGFLFLLGAPSAMFVGYGVSRMMCERVEFEHNITSPFRVR